MSRIVYIVVFVFLFLFGIIFAILNADPVELNYYFGSQQVALSFALIVAMFIGAILGVIASVGLIMRHRRELSRLRKANSVAEKEISNLRAIPIKDQH